MTSVGRLAVYTWHCNMKNIPNKWCFFLVSWGIQKNSTNAADSLYIFILRRFQCLVIKLFYDTKSIQIKLFIAFFNFLIKDRKCYVNSKKKIIQIYCIIYWICQTIEKKRVFQQLKPLFPWGNSMICSIVIFVLGWPKIAEFWNIVQQSMKNLIMLNAFLNDQK